MKKYLLTMLLFFFSVTSYSQELVIVTEDFPPYNYMQDGKISGISTEVVQAVLKQAKLESVTKSFPWARAYMLAMHKKNHLIYSIARIPERENLFHWVGAISPYQTSFFKLKEREEIKVSNLNDAKKYSIGCSIADVNTIYLEEKGFTNLEQMPDDSQNLTKLIHGRVDMIVYEENSFVYKIKELGLEPSMFERVYRLEELTDELYMALSKTSDLTLFNKLRAGLKAIKDNGVYSKIHQKSAMK